MSESSSHVLVIAYEFPPSAGPGVQRIANFVKYLLRDGWRVSVVCAEPVAGRPLDASMEAEVEGARVTRLPARHVATGIAHTLSPLKQRMAASGARPAPAAPEPQTSGAGEPAGHKRLPISTRLSRLVAVPDDAVLWRREAARAATQLHARDPFDVVFATAPPYSAALAGVDAGRSIGVPCVVDLRDPWRDNAGVEWPTPWHRAHFEQLERVALSKAFAVTAVSEPIAEEARSMGAIEAVVIPNGYDPEGMPEWSPDAEAPLTIAFLGRFGMAVTNPRPFFAGLAIARGRNGAARAAKLRVVGPEFPWVDELAAAYDVSDAVTTLGYLPHDEALREISKADAGLLVLDDVPGAAAIYSSKLFEYLGVGLPVLFVGPERCVAADVVREAEAGLVEPVGDPVAIAEAIIRLAEDKRRGLTLPPPRREVVERFDRRAQAAALSRLLSDAIGASL